MKIQSKYILALICATLALPAFAGTEAGDDSALYYRNNPEKYDGKTVDIDVAFVTRINRRNSVEGLVFFVAHTVDDENNTRGGAIIVAVLDDDIEKFMRKYGTSIERKSRGDIDTERLRGTFHQLKGGRVYIDESGEAHELILAHLEEKADFTLPDAEEALGPGLGNGPRRRG
ncbi:MAG: hypothetical protein ACPGSB_03285 [Opitutales bacterium]